MACIFLGGFLLFFRKWTDIFYKEDILLLSLSEMMTNLCWLSNVNDTVSFFYREYGNSTVVFIKINVCRCILSKSTSSAVLFRGPLEPPTKKEMVPLAKRPDEWKDPWRRSKSPRRRPGLMGSPPRGRRRHRPSGSSVSLSNSSR